MSALATRLLVLGAVRIFGPVNGYQLRRELLSWEVERWARLRPGSIYSMLATLEKEGSVERHDLAEEGERPVAVYTLTPAGDDEFLRLVTEAIAVPPPSGDTVPLRAALSFAPALARAEFLTALGRRSDALAAELQRNEDSVERLDAMPPSVPPHVVAELELEAALLKAQYDWLLRFGARVQGGGLSFRGEDDPGWTPPDDDPGWRMMGERERYLRLLGGGGSDPA